MQCMTQSLYITKCLMVANVAAFIVPCAFYQYYICESATQHCNNTGMRFIPKFPPSIEFRQFSDNPVHRSERVWPCDNLNQFKINISFRNPTAVIDVKCSGKAMRFYFAYMLPNGFIEEHPPLMVISNTVTWQKGERFGHVIFSDICTIFLWRYIVSYPLKCVLNPY